MTSEEIKKESPLFYAALKFQWPKDALPADQACACWLREIAYQLAVLNESHNTHGLSDPQPGESDAESSPASGWPRLSQGGDGKWLLKMSSVHAEELFDSEAAARDSIKQQRAGKHTFEWQHFAGSAGGLILCSNCFKTQDECVPSEPCSGVPDPQPGNALGAILDLIRDCRECGIPDSDIVRRILQRVAQHSRVFEPSSETSSTTQKCPNCGSTERGHWWVGFHCGKGGHT